MARTNNLSNFLTDVANAIREKKGTEGTILASDFDTEIESLPSGGGDYNVKVDTSKAYNTSNRIGGLITEIKSLDVSSMSDISSLFYGCVNLETIPMINTTNTQRAGYLFYNCSNLKSIPKIDISNVTTTSNMFYGCSSLTEVPKFNISKSQNCDSMFRACSKLTTIAFDDANNCNPTNTSSMFDGCSSLTLIDLRGFGFKNVGSNSFAMFANVPSNCIIIVKDSIQKEWLVSKFASREAYIKTVAEYEIEQGE